MALNFAHLAPQPMSAGATRRFNSRITGRRARTCSPTASIRVMVTAAGSGYSRWRDIAVTRWREDPTCDALGFFVFLRDVANGAGVVGRLPADRLRARRLRGRPSPRIGREIIRADGPIVTATEILVSPEDDAEVRRVSMTNRGPQHARDRGDELRRGGAGERRPPTPRTRPSRRCSCKPSSSPTRGTLLATRRSREPAEPPLWMFHRGVRGGRRRSVTLQFETDRARFLGRGRELRDAASASRWAQAPVEHRRHRARSGVRAAAPGAHRRPAQPRASPSGAEWRPSRAQALALADKYRDAAAFERTKTRRGRRRAAELRELGHRRRRGAAIPMHRQPRAVRRLIAARFARDLEPQRSRAAALLWSRGHFRRSAHRAGAARRSRASWSSSSSCCGRIEYWRRKRLAVDLVDPQRLRRARTRRACSGRSTPRSETPSARRARRTARARGGVFSLSRRFDAAGEPGAPADRRSRDFRGARGLLCTTSCGRLRERGCRAVRGLAAWARSDATGALAPTPRSRPDPRILQRPRRLRGRRGASTSRFSRQDEWTPAPWSNVIANPQFGFLVSADGAGSTWSINAQQNQLTPWSNDPVSNAPAEVVYIRDEESGDLWSATPLPIREAIEPYVVRHGFGYSRFEHTSHGIAIGAAAIRAARGSAQDIAAEDRQSLGACRGSCRSPITSTGCSATSAAAPRRSSSPRSIPRHRR